MGAVSYLRDRLANIMTGAGTSNDARSHNFHVLNRLTYQQIEASYRSSWLMRNAVDIPPYDMTRAWRDWQADDDQIEIIEAEERRLGLREKVRKALILGRLGGGALILGLGDDPSTPLPTTIGTGALKYAHVLSRYRVTLGQIIQDPASPWFGEPEFFQLASTNGVPAKIHPSRVIPFRGLQVPDMGLGIIDDWYWGDPIAQSIQDAVNDAETATGGFASLISKARVGVLKVPQLMERWATDEHEQQFLKRLALANVGASTHQMMVIDGEEDWSQFEVTWAGMPDVIKIYLSVVAGATQIPATRLLGKAPDGMNATGEGDERNYNTMVSGKQENELRPLLDRIDAVMLPSIGIADPDVGYAFAPLSVLSEKEKADIAYTKAQAVQIYANTALVPTIALEKGVQNMLSEDELLPGLDGALAELSEDERFPSLSAPDPNEVDPALGDPALDPANDPAAAAIPTRRAANDQRFTDAAPRTLYVSRKLLNAADFIRWAKGQGFDTTTPADELRVTIAFSRQPLDWMKIGQDWSSDKDGNLTVPAGGPRIVQALGDKGAVVLLFASNDLKWRHDAFKEAGASFDFDEYQPHVTITYQVPAGLDLSKVQPYTGPLKFGPELFAEVVDNWEQGVTEE
jgi:phage-related protein (TIGR01555 family)